MKKTILYTSALLFSLSAMIPSAKAEAAEVSARSAVLIEADSGDIIYEKNSCERLGMASTTKIMTAVVVLEAGDIDKKVAVSPSACGVEGSSIYLTEGEVLSREDLLYAVLLESANDAAAALAIEIGGSIDGFAEMMNSKAKELGLENTHFTNPHGLDSPEHYTTARDLSEIARYAMQNEKFREIVATKSHRITREGEGKVISLANHNKLLRLSDSADGIKTGYTKRCGRCLVSSATKDGVHVIAVTLSAPDDWNDHLSLHELGFSEYEHVTLAEIGEVKASIPTVGRESTVAENRDSLSLTLKKGTEIKVVIDAPHILFSPPKIGECIGHASFYAGEKLLGKLPIYTAE